jgi:ABC-2 type transport system ATP-binding protein
VIEVRGLTKSYGDRLAIDSLSFSVSKGEVVGFLGPNGAGKSTTMKIITGFMAPSAGQAVVCGFDVFENPIEVKKRIGYLPETPPVYGDMLVEEYLSYVAQLKQVPKDKIRQRVAYALEKTNLGDVRRRLIQNLSKGFRQRVGIAQALVSDPEVLILDEPTVGLDPKQVAEIRHLIQELRGQHTIILSTHILSEVQATCERIIIIHQGKIVAEDKLERLTQLKKGAQVIRLKVEKFAAAKEIVVKENCALTKISGVSQVQVEEESKSLLVTTDNRSGLIDEVAAWVLQQKLGLLELTQAKQDLESVFLQLTYDSSLAMPETGGNVNPHDTGTGLSTSTNKVNSSESVNII